MTGYSPVGRHLILTGFRFTLDALLVPVSMIAGMSWRFGDVFADKLRMYAPAVFVAAVVLPSLSYIGGLYSAAAPRFEAWVRVRWFLFSLAATLFVLLGMGSVDLDARVGRGVLLYGMLILSVLYAGHHFLLPRRFRMPPTEGCLSRFQCRRCDGCGDSRSQQPANPSRGSHHHRGCTSPDSNASAIGSAQ